MKLRHPFEWLDPAHLTRTFLVVLVVAVLVMLALNLVGAPLKTAAAPAGIVSYELAGALPTARAILDSWGQSGKIYAGLNLGLDFLFLASYPLAIGLGALLVARQLAPGPAWLSALGVVVAWLQPAAGLLDAVENTALIRLLLGSDSAALPALARGGAMSKFLLVAAGLVYLLPGAAVAASRLARNRG